MQDSALDDPKYVAVMVGDWLSSWQHHTAGPSYAEAHLVRSGGTTIGTTLMR